MIELYLLLIFIIIAAVVAVESHNLLSSVVSVGAVGLGLCIILLLLGAPEIAITQLVVEILALIVLIRATIAVSVPESYKGRELHSYGVAIIFMIIILAGSYFTFLSLHDFGDTSMNTWDTYIVKGMELTGATNLVAAISIAFRKIDILAATAVLFTAVIGILSILRPKGRKKPDERDATYS